MKNTFRMLSLAAMGAALMGVAAMGPAKGMEIAKVGEKAPSWTLMDLDGEEHSLEDFKGNIVVIEWNNPDCPYIQKVYSEGTVAETIEMLKEMDEDIKYIAINSTANKPKETVIKDTRMLLQENDVEIPALVDYDGKVFNMYGARTTPHMFVIDADQVLRYEGAFTSNDERTAPGDTNNVINAVKQIMAGETVAPDHVKAWGCSIKNKRVKHDDKDMNKDRS